MRVTPLTVLACPLDGLPLRQEGAQYQCSSGHSFDRAREGYCNLLVVQHKASIDPGDSKDMVAARRRVLEAGHYAPIAAHLFDDHVRPLTNGHQGPFRIVDAGCGDGDCLDRIAQKAIACDQSGELELAGLDVSKWAIKAAAKRKAPVTWLVANNRTPPFARGIEVILCLFGFPVWEGFKTVQVEGQRVLLVDPGPDHLIELREIIYPVVHKSPPPALPLAAAAGYHLANETTVRFQTTLTTQQMIADLVGMTPHGHRMSQDGRIALAALDRCVVTVEVVVRTLVLGRSP
jgi:23S rRNA (guanine745-N1)-methyltransferase